MKPFDVAALLFFLAVLLISPLPVLSDPELNLSNVTAGAGNTTQLNIDGSRETILWQGFFGEVSGGITLANGAGESIYNWNLVEAVGELYATRNLIVDWTEINCTNQTQLYREEELLNILNDSTDGINDTFQNTTHPLFSVANRDMIGCRSTLTSNFTQDESVFWNVMLSSNSTNVVYTVIMDDNTIGFNNTAIDYQLLVPVDRLTGQSLYFIYVELN